MKYKQDFATINDKISFKEACKLESANNLDLGNSGYYLMHIRWFRRLQEKHPDCEHVLFRMKANFNNPKERCALVLARQKGDPPADRQVRLERHWKRLDREHQRHLKTKTALA